MDDRQFDQKTAREWIEMAEGPGSLVREGDLYPLLREWVNKANPSEILDIGCGQGVCSEKIDLRRRRYTGVEPSPYLLQRALELYPEPNKRFILGNAYDLPVADAAVDATFSIAVWHLLEDKAKAASELGRALKDGGQFMIVTANPDTYDEWTRTYASSKRDGHRFEGCMRQADGSEATDVLYLHTYEEIVASLRAAHLEVQATRAFRTALAIQGRKASK